MTKSEREHHHRAGTSSNEKLQNVQSMETYLLFDKKGLELTFSPFILAMVMV